MIYPVNPVPAFKLEGKLDSKDGCKQNAPRIDVVSLG